MIYLDNSATTFPKPPQVYRAVNQVMREYGFNPGRGGYRRSLMTSKKVYETRKLIKDFFHAPAEEAVIFTPSCTYALNAVLKGVLHHGDHVVISSLEHNAVLRPLEKLRKDGVITYSVARIGESDEETLANFRREINHKTRLFVCTHASNVFGTRLPVERLCALAHSNGVRFCLDAAQSAGILDINIERDGYDYVCCAGHKYLYGMMGTGLLLLGSDRTIDTMIEGGTGSESDNRDMPSYYPDRLESGTLNIPGIIALGAGVSFISKIGIERIYQKEMRLIRLLHSRLSEVNRVEVYGDYSDHARPAPVLSFNMKDRDSERVAQLLSERSDIAVRSGLHCAPLAHETMGTLDSGTVRVAPSYFTTESDMNILLNSLRKFP